MIGYVAEFHHFWHRWWSRIVFCFDIQENCVPKAIQNWHTKWLLLLSWQFSHLIEENSASIASDEQRGLCVTGLNYEGANLSIHLPPGRRATTIGEHVICGGRIYASLQWHWPVAHAVPREDSYAPHHGCGHEGNLCEILAKCLKLQCTLLTNIICSPQLRIPTCYDKPGTSQLVQSTPVWKALPLPGL